MYLPTYTGTYIPIYLPAYLLCIIITGGVPWPEHGSFLSISPLGNFHTEIICKWRMASVLDYSKHRQQSGVSEQFSSHGISRNAIFESSGISGISGNSSGSGVYDIPGFSSTSLRRGKRRRCKRHSRCGSNIRLYARYDATRHAEERYDRAKLISFVSAIALAIVPKSY